MTSRTSTFLTLAAAAVFAILPTGASMAQSWQETLAAARGQTVFFNAWAGSPKINAYIEWVADRVDTEFGIALEPEIVLAGSLNARWAQITDSVEVV